MSLLISFIGGAVVMVLIAGALIAIDGQRAFRMRYSMVSKGTTIWQVHIGNSIGVEQIFWNRYDTSLNVRPANETEARAFVEQNAGSLGFSTTGIPAWSRYGSTSELSTVSAEDPGVVEQVVGWPLPWVWSDMRLLDSNGLAGYITPRRGSSLSDGAVFNNIWPKRILWWSAVADLSMLATAGWVTFFGWPLSRMWMRCRLGCCLHCGYSRSGLDPTKCCPECAR